MVTTRRQSGKLPPPLTVLSTNDVETSEDEDAFGGYESSTDVTDSDDDDFDTKHPGRKGRPPAKRAKPNETPSKTAAKVKNKGTDLSGIVDIPLDVLFEIFGRVSPNDLLNLTRTNKMLRSTLMSKGAITIWKAVLKGRNAPKCPKDFSEPRWTHLLFGGNVCHICGGKGVKRIDFGLRRRACTSCLKDKLVVVSKFRTRFPDYDPAVLDLLPYTNIGGWAHGYPSKSKFYWLDDIYDMVKELGKYQKDVKLRKRGAKQALDDFTQARIKFVAANAANAEKSSRWVSAHAGDQEEEKKARIDQRYHAIKARLLQLGHLEQDMLRLSRYSAVDKDAELTDRSWSRIRAAVEGQVNQAKSERIARERQSIIDSRKKVIKKVYSDYKKTLFPTQWAYHPDDNQVYKFEGFASLINDPSASGIEPSQCHEAVQKLPSLVQAFNEEKKAALLSLVRRRDSGSNSDIAGNAGPACLDLATSIFQCSTPGCRYRLRTLIAWQRAVCHVCHVCGGYPGQGYGYTYPYSQLQRGDPLTPTLTFSDRGSKAVESLAVLLELDARAAVPADYDRKVARFVCRDCNPCTRSGIRGLEALTWRDCVAHFVEDKRHMAPSWKLLTDQEAMEVKLREGSQVDLADRDDAWSCNHCAVHLENMAKREPVLEHLKNTHGNTNPTEGVDFFYDQRRCRTSRIPVLFGTTTRVQKQDHRCLHCGGSRLFVLRGVTDHLKSKHKITNPVIGRDMQKI